MEGSIAMFCVMKKEFKAEDDLMIRYRCLSKYDTEKGACLEVERLILSGIAEKDLSIFQEKPFRALVTVMCSEHA